MAILVWRICNHAPISSKWPFWFSEKAILRKWGHVCKFYTVLPIIWHPSIFIWKFKFTIWFGNLGQICLCDSGNWSKSKIVTQRSEKVKGLDNIATLYAFVELCCKVTDGHLFQLEPIFYFELLSQRMLKITSILVKHMCLEEIVCTYFEATEDLYVILILGINALVSCHLLNVWLSQF